MDKLHATGRRWNSGIKPTDPKAAMPQTFNATGIPTFPLAISRTEPAASALRPDTLLLGCLRDPRLRIRKPIPTAFSKENDQVIATAGELNDYGAGANRSAAVTELQHAIAGLYHSLEADKDRLGPGLEPVRKTLQEHIQPRNEAREPVPIK